MTDLLTSTTALRRAQRFRSGFRAVGLGLVANLGLVVLKGAIGIIGNSQGLVADAIHSAADLVNSFSVLISLAISRRPGDIAHPYGHGRAEALAAIFASFVIGLAGLVTGWDSIVDLRSGRRDAPSLITLWVALLAVAIKVGMSIYATRVARRIQSKAVGADARDHLTDAVASGFVVAGILVARLGHPAFDALGGFIVAGFIIYTAFEIFHEAALELMDTSLSVETRERVLLCVEAALGRGCVSGIAGRTIADSTVIEVHLDLDPAMSVGAAAGLMDDVKRRVMAESPEITNVIVEMNSAMDEPSGLSIGRGRAR